MRGSGDDDERGDGSELDRLRRFAAVLGPASEVLARSPETQILVLTSTRRGAELEDAFLRELFIEARENPRAANEFFGHLLALAPELAHGELRPELRNVMETSDVVQSVCADLVGEMDSLEFRTRGEFLSLIRKRSNWKASDAARHAFRDKRREDRRADTPADELGIEDGDPTPQTRAAGAEWEDRLITALLRLSERDRDLVRLHLEGRNAHEIARAQNLDLEAARKARQRALERLRKNL